MKFLIQKCKGKIVHDFTFALSEAIRFQKWSEMGHDIVVKYLDFISRDIYTWNFKDYHINYVPVGSTEFVNAWFNHFYGHEMKPINVPEELFKFQYTQRNIWNGDENGYVNHYEKLFVKSNDKIKGFGPEIIYQDRKLPEGNYQFSELIKIDSEWRAFVSNNRVKKIHRTYKFELLPNEAQKTLLDKHFGCVRYIYNHFLNERKEQYQADKKTDNYYGQAKILTELKKQEDTIWLKEVNSQTLQFALRSLDTAYVNFFRGNAKFPRFKSRKNKNTFTVPQHTKVVDGRIYVPKFKSGIKVNIHREIKGEVGKFTISKTPTGKYFVSILTEEEYHPSKKTDKSVGMDLGLKDFAITSDGIKYKNNRYTKRYERKLKKAQQHLSRKQKGSNGFEKQKLKVAKIHEKITNTRQDVLHKVSNDIVSNYDIICLEDLNVKGMIKNRKLSKHIADASWGTFVRFVEYKADWNNKTVVKINRWYPSSKTCNACNYINQDLNLSIREWTCKSCNTVHDRDFNASQNILKEGLKIYGEELAITKVEDKSDYLGSTSVETRSPSHRFSVGG